MSPALLFLVIDPLLRQLQSLCIGATVNNMYTGASLHADDICTLASNLSSLEAQVTTVKEFTEENFLKLNALNIIFRKPFVKGNGDNLKVGEESFSLCSEATCLEYCWRQDLSSLPKIQDRIQKARKVFFSKWKCLCLSGQAQFDLILFKSEDVYCLFSFIESKIG